VRALSSFGIKARFVQSAGWADIERQIATGIPVPCGFLHRGPVTAPGGGGHWLIVVGFTPTQLIVHDPFGEADLVNGTTLGGGLGSLATATRTSDPDGWWRGQALAGRSSLIAKWPSIT
jgi:hypothetical protein